MYLRIIATTDGKNRRKKINLAMWPIFEGGQITLGSDYIFYIQKISTYDRYVVLSNSNYVIVGVIEDY